MSSSSDLLTLAAGAGAWSLAIVPVKWVGTFCAQGAGPTNKILAMTAVTILAYITTPLMSMLFGWKTPHQKVRGIALALGAAQVTDGIMQLWFPTFYNNDHRVGILSASNIFLGAGLTGIFSALQ